MEAEKENYTKEEVKQIKRRGILINTTGGLIGGIFIGMIIGMWIKATQ